MATMPRAAAAGGREMLRRACWIVVLLVLMPIAASADAVDMVQWARIEGSDTRDTFMGLWPRETDDAPYTVRDGDPETSWKLVNGRQTLTLDFAPLMDRAVEMESIEAEWNLAPSGRVNVYLYRYCGGELVDRGHWEDPHWPYVRPGGKRPLPRAGYRGFGPCGACRAKRVRSAVR